MLRSIQSCILAAIWRALASLGAWLQGQRGIEELRVLARSLMADGRDLDRLANELETARATGEKLTFNGEDVW